MLFYLWWSVWLFIGLEPRRYVVLTYVKEAGASRFIVRVYESQAGFGFVYLPCVIDGVTTLFADGETNYKSVTWLHHSGWSPEELIEAGWDEAVQTDGEH